MSASKSLHNLFPCWLSAPLSFRVAFPPLQLCTWLLLRRRLPHLAPVPPPVRVPSLTALAPHPAATEGLTSRLQPSSLSHQHPSTNCSSLSPAASPRTRLVISWRRSCLLIGVPLQLTAFLACTLFRPQTTPFFCVWKACSSCWARGTNQALYRQLQKLFPPKSTAILLHLV